jgi:DNA-binding GntR family transcriptional regulator
MVTVTPSQSVFIEPDNLYEDLYTTLLERIVLGDLKPGAVLSENNLAKEFTVSRTPIRRVLQHLEYDSLVSTKHGVGTIVNPINIIEIKELYDLRMKLAELFGVLPPIARVKDNDIELFDAFLERSKQLQPRNDVRELARLNLEMHRAQLNHIGNRALREIFDKLYCRSIRLWMQLLGEMDWDEEVRALQSELEQTLEAMRNQDIYTIGMIRRNGISLSLGRIKTYLGGSSEVQITSTR